MTHTNLRPIGAGVHLWQPEPGHGWGLANCGLVVSRGSAACIDSPHDLDLAHRFRAQCLPLLDEGRDIEWLLVTHANGDHLWGAPAVPTARVVYTREAVHHLVQEPDPASLHALVHEGDDITSRYLKRHFGGYNWSSTQLPRPAVTFTGQVEIRVGDVVVELTQLDPGHTVGDLMAYLPAQRIAFSGDVIFASSADQPGDHPVHWAGPLANVIAACDQVLSTDAELIVPGHGPLLDRAGVAEHQKYLHYLRERSHELFALGIPLGQAVRRIISEHRYPHLHLPERLLVTVGAEYRHLGGEADPPMLSKIAAMARLAEELERPGVPEQATRAAAPIA